MSRFNNSLNRILQFPEIVEHFSVMEKEIVEGIIKSYDDYDETSRLVDYLRIIRKFKTGAARIEQIHELVEN